MLVSLPLFLHSHFLIYNHIVLSYNRKEREVGFEPTSTNLNWASKLSGSQSCFTFEMDYIGYCSFSLPETFFAEAWNVDLGFYLIKVGSATFRFELTLALFLNFNRWDSCKILPDCRRCSDHVHAFNYALRVRWATLAKIRRLKELLILWAFLVR